MRDRPDGSPEQHLDALYRHAAGRARIRYQLNLTRADWIDLSALIAASPDSLVLPADSRRRSIHRLMWKAREIQVAYDVDARCVVTFLPIGPGRPAPEDPPPSVSGELDPRDESGGDLLPPVVRPGEPCPLKPGAGLPDPNDFETPEQRSERLCATRMPCDIVPVIEAEIDALSPYYQGDVDIHTALGEGDERREHDRQEVEARARERRLAKQGGTQMPESETTQPAAATPRPPTFKRASRAQGRLRIGLFSASGGGKTYTSLLFADGMAESLDQLQGPKPRVQRICLIDTENFSSSDYALNDGEEPRPGYFEFSQLCITPPYTLGKYLAAMEEAERNGCDILIVDSIAHLWKAEGGLLDQKDKLDNAGGGSWQNWAKISPLHARFVAKILHNKVHLIITCRTKQEYSAEKDTKTGALKLVKLGMAPEFRDGIEYEVTVAFDLNAQHYASSTKDRTGMFADGSLFTPDRETGKQLLAWRLSGAPDAAPAIVEEPEAPTAAAAPAGAAPKPAANGKVTPAQWDALRALAKAEGLSIHALAQRHGHEFPLTPEKAEAILATKPA